MRKVLSLVLIGLLVIPALSLSLSGVKAQETTLFYDDFESYAVGAKPTPPWEFWFNTNGIITTTTYVSPVKSLRLLGSTGWSCAAVRRFSSSSRVIGFEVYGKVESFGAQYTSLGVAFQKKTSATTSAWIAAVRFSPDGQIRAGDKVLQPYQLNRWYKIKVLYYRDRMTYDVWIDDVLRVSAVPENYPNPYDIDGLGLISDWAAVNCYFDNAKVFEIGELYSLPANAILPDRSLIDRAILRSITPSQTIIASPGQKITLTVSYQIWQGQNPSEIDQLLLIYSWTPSWPPPKGYYVGIYNGIPPSYPGTTGSVQVDITVPTTSGTYYLWLGWAAHYGIDQAASTFTKPLSLPAYVKIVVQGYSLSVDFVEANVNGKQINSPDVTTEVAPGGRVTGYLKVNVNNNRGGSWITPVIGTASWGRTITGTSKGWFVTITSDAPTGKSTQTFSFDLLAPSAPGTYYIGIFAGWMYSGDEVASNDHPPNFGDGDDVWDMKQSDWESVLLYGQAPEGAVYRMPGRVIRIVVLQTQDTTPPSVRVLSPNGGESLVVGSTFRIRWEATDNVGVSHVHIWLFQDSNQVAVIVSNYPNAGYYDWTVPDGPGAGYRVRIAAVDVAGNSAYDDSDSTFSIVRVMPKIPLLTIADYNIGVNDMIVVDVMLTNGSFIAGGSFEIHFDTNIVTAVNVQEGDFGSPVYSIDNNAGVVKVAVAKPVAVNKDVASMAKVSFKGVNVGFTTLSLKDASLNDENGNLIVPSSKDGSITVSQWLKGDVNHNGKLDTGDATMVLQMVVGIRPPDMLGDMNNNGSIDTGDATIILRKVVGLNE